MKAREPAHIKKDLKELWRGYAMAAAGSRTFDAESLLAKAVPAGAVALGLLGGAGALADNIVYTPANVTISPTCLVSAGCTSYARLKGSLGIDLNHDGVNDFRVVQASHFNLSSASGRLAALAPGSNGVAKGPKGALGLSRGDPIGYNLAFRKGSALMARWIINFYPIGVSHPTSRASGSWINADRFLGLEFKIGGSIHFGWAEFNVPSFGPGWTATLEGYAYDTVAGQSLYAGQTTSAPEPGTLGLLALGSLGLGLWRLRKAASSQ